MAIDIDNVISDNANPVVSSIRAPNEIIFIAYKNTKSAATKSWPILTFTV